MLLLYIITGADDAVVQVQNTRQFVISPLGNIHIPYSDRVKTTDGSYVEKRGNTVHIDGLGTFYLYESSNISREDTLVLKCTDSANCSGIIILDWVKPDPQDENTFFLDIEKFVARHSFRKGGIPQFHSTMHCSTCLCVTQQGSAIENIALEQLGRPIPFVEICSDFGNSTFSVPDRIKVDLNKLSEYLSVTTGALCKIANPGKGSFLFYFVACYKNGLLGNVSKTCKKTLMDILGVKESQLKRLCREVQVVLPTVYDGYQQHANADTDAVAAFLVSHLVSPLVRGYGGVS